MTNKTNVRREILIIGAADSPSKAALNSRINTSYLQRQYLEQSESVAVVSSPDDLQEVARNLIRQQLSLLFFAFSGGRVDQQLHPKKSRENTDLDFGQARSYLNQDLR